MVSKEMSKEIIMNSLLRSTRFEQPSDVSQKFEPQDSSIQDTINEIGSPKIEKNASLSLLMKKHKTQPNGPSSTKKVVKEKEEFEPEELAEDDQTYAFIKKQTMRLWGQEREKKNEIDQDESQSKSSIKHRSKTLAPGSNKEFRDDKSKVSQRSKRKLKVKEEK